MKCLYFLCMNKCNKTSWPKLYSEDLSYRIIHYFLTQIYNDKFYHKSVCMQSVLGCLFQLRLTLRQTKHVLVKYNLYLHLTLFINLEVSFNFQNLYKNYICTLNFSLFTNSILKTIKFFLFDLVFFSLFWIQTTYSSQFFM